MVSLRMIEIRKWTSAKAEVHFDSWLHLSCDIGLGLVELGVHTALCHQLLVGASLGDDAVGDGDDPACGLPIVASSVRGNTDLIDPGQGGFLVEPNDAAGFADAIRRILAQPGIREQMKQHNLKKIRTYSIEAVTEQMARLYQPYM